MLYKILNKNNYSKVNKIILIEKVNHKQDLNSMKIYLRIKIMTRAKNARPLNNLLQNFYWLMWIILLVEFKWVTGLNL